ncbi:MAG TPA: hypothetical protein PLF13_02755 [candidate division Zixibacteria bacterium]|nr:hypothetical protein [candidate division Zixibacteria bacterium]
MGSLELFVICASALAAVFLLLAVLALLMRSIILIFPQKPAITTDTALIAAVASVVTAMYPGTQVTSVEEI